MEDGLHDVEEYLDGRAKQTAAATEQVLDGLLGEGGDGDTSVEGVLSGLSAGGVREVAGSLQERIRAAQAAIAAGYSKLGEMQRGAARDAEAERVRQLEEELKKMEAGLHDVEEYLDGRAKQTAAATEQVLDGLLGEGGDGDTSVEGVLSGLSAGGVREVAGSLQERIRAAQAAIAAGYSKLGEMQRGAARDAEAERLQQLEEELKKMEDGLHDVEEYLDGRAK